MTWTFPQAMRELHRRNTEHLAELEATIRERDGEAGIEKLKADIAALPPRPPGWENEVPHWSDDD
jgi:hypothetical protein